MYWNFKIKPRFWGLLAKLPNKFQRPLLFQINQNIVQTILINLHFEGYHHTTGHFIKLGCVWIANPHQPQRLHFEGYHES